MNMNYFDGHAIRFNGYFLFIFKGCLNLCQK